MFKRSASLEQIKKEYEKDRKFDFYFFQGGFKNKKSQSIPDLNLKDNFINLIQDMVLVEEARKSLHCTDGTKDIRKFIELADRFHDRIVNDGQREAFHLCILSKLEGRAYDVARTFDEIDWPTLKEALENTFVEKHTITNLHTQLTNCVQKQQETVIQYSLRLKEILKNLSKAYKEQDGNIVFYDGNGPALAAFEEGLIDPNTRILIKAANGSFEEAIELAHLEEQRKKNKISKESAGIVKCTFCIAEGHTLSDCIKFKKENNICQVCKSVGHFPSDCPNKNKITSQGNNYRPPNRWSQPGQQYRNNYNSNFNNNFNRAPQNNNMRYDNYQNRNFNGNGQNRNQYSNAQNNYNRNYQNNPGNSGNNYRNSNIHNRV
jgi:Retrotransposon gag protein